VVLEPQPDCPAAQLANRQIAAAYDDPEALDELARSADVVTYEFENVPVDAANRLASAVPVFPPPRALEISQDRVTEKTFLNAHGISTAAFRTVDNDGDIAAALDAFGGSGVLKTRRLGYDGKGQMVIRAGEARDDDGVYAAMGNVPLILEELVPFECEISVIAARGRDGAVAAFDPARNVHREGILRSSTVPAGVAEKVAEEARRASFGLLDALDYVGVIGVEFFVTADGRVLANEFAPRVHNSGHWTEAACVASQFEQHIRAIAGLPLGETGRHSNCVMENLIGDDMDRVPALLGEPDVLFHLYGKAETRPGRKMGHFTRLSARA
jgi:5-(carboxyamino)imidazole ribonucleotide synthase